MKKRNKKTWFFKENQLKLTKNKMLIINIIRMKELKAQAVKLKWETTEKLKNLDIEIAGVELWTYDDKINHLIWFFEKYNKNHKKEIENNLM